MRTGMLTVPGASLYYEVRGSGPVLLMIPGGPMDASGFTALADRLADRYTVVTYDCRGNSRSPMEGSWDDLTVGLFAADADLLLEAVSDKPAYVLGSSGGATYALDLVARCPGLVRALVAHEPPVSELLPDGARYHALNEEVGETYRRQGVGAAMQKFAAGVGFGGNGPGPQARPQSADAPEAGTVSEAGTGAERSAGNLELFAGRLIPMIGNFQPDVEVLRSSPVRIVVGVGDESTPEQMTYQTSYELARRLGSEPVKFRGGHGGFASHPDSFAATLHEVLAAGG
jgi:pimeloyl-ACP methyl ester carboxylesterase